MKARGVTFLTRFLLLGALFFQAPVSFGWWFYTPGDTVDNVGYAPKQPIPFSHKLHAGDRQIPCQYCHSSTRRSAVAGIPPLNVCMGCHKNIAIDKPDIQTITDHYKRNDPIKWVKVHDVPDYVRFTHKRHIAADGANLECQECHGNVQEMDVVEQVAPLQMGWCLGCHVERGGPRNCFACHY